MSCGSEAPRAAIDAGWKRAFVAIFDANVTTLISAFVLIISVPGR